MAYPFSTSSANRRHDHAATICAFDLIEVDGADLQRNPIEERKERLSVFKWFGTT